MLRSDGLKTSHPTFVLDLYNHKIRNQLQKLGSVCLNTDDTNPYTTVDVLRQLLANNMDRKTLIKNFFPSNVPGTKPYRVNTSNVFKRKVDLFFIHMLIKCILQFFIQVVLLNITIVDCVFFIPLCIMY